MAKSWASLTCVGLGEKSGGEAAALGLMQHNQEQDDPYETGAQLEFYAATPKIDQFHWYDPEWGLCMRGVNNMRPRTADEFGKLRSFEQLAG